MRPSDVETVEAAVAPLGFIVRALPMHFAGGAMEIRRVSKIDSTDGDVLMLDLLLATDPLREVWETREYRSLAGVPLPVVSRGSRGHQAAERMKSVDYSDRAITMRVKRVSQLRFLCLTLARTKAIPKPVVTKG